MAECTQNTAKIVSTEDGIRMRMWPERYIKACGVIHSHPWKWRLEKKQRETLLPTRFPARTTGTSKVNAFTNIHVTTIIVIIAWGLRSEMQRL